MTPSDLYKSALQDLGVLAAGEEPDPEDALKVAEKYTSLYAMLEGKRLVGWTAMADVPSYAEIPVTAMLAFLCAPAFNVDPQKRLELGILGSIDADPPSLAERQLRKSFTSSYHYTPARPSYF
jgi:hypothetical protein